MERHTADRLKSLDIVVDPRGVRFLFEGARKTPTVLEPCVQIREGTYDIENVGGYTYFGGRSELLRHTKSIGRFCSIAGGVLAGQVEHPTSLLSTASCLYGDWQREWPTMAPFYQANKAEVKAAIAATGQILRPKSKKIVIGNDVWIGYGALISRGVTIGDGAIVAARSIVTRDVPPYTIVGGSPAKPMRLRFADHIVKRLLELRWWDYGTDALHGVDQTDIEAAVVSIEKNIAAGASLWRPDVALVSPSGAVHQMRHPLLPGAREELAWEVLLPGAAPLATTAVNQATDHIRPTAKG